MRCWSSCCQISHTAAPTPLLLLAISVLQTVLLHTSALGIVHMTYWSALLVVCWSSLVIIGRCWCQISHQICGVEQKGRKVVTKRENWQNRYFRVVDGPQPFIAWHKDQKVRQQNTFGETRILS